MDGHIRDYVCLAQQAYINQLARPKEEWQEIDYKRLLTVTASAYLACFGRQFCETPEEQTLIRRLWHYFDARPGGDLNPTRGLMLCGPVGVGKTTLLRIFAEYRRPFREGFRIETAIAWVDRYRRNGQAGFANGSYDQVEVAIDDLGREPLTVQHFGNACNLMEQILADRYDLWQRSGIRTFITTNLSPIAIRDRYGEHILDRCREMFNVIPLEGSSRRGTK